MKKFFMFCGIAILPSYLLAAGSGEGAENGLFVGLETGYSVSFMDTTTTGQQGTTDKATAAPALINVGVKVGYNFYFASWIGLRGYVDYTYGFNFSDSNTTEQNTTTTSTTVMSVHNITANVDVLFNFYNGDSLTFGAFAGIGLGYGALEEKTNDATTSTINRQADAFILPINLGLSMIAGGKHRFDLTFKIPTLGLKDKAVTNNQGGGNTGEEVITRFLTTSIGYSYTF